MPLIPAYYYRSVCLCRKGNYQNALKVFLQRGKPTRGIRPKQHLSGCLACFLAAIPARLWTQMEIHLLPVPSWLVFLFYSHLLAPPLKSLSASRSPVPHRALIRQFILFLWAPSSICGCDSQSPRRRSIPSRDLDTQPCQHCSINPFPLSHVNFSHVRRLVLTLCHSLTYTWG